jgi:hypothetical protein
VVFDTELVKMDVDSALFKRAIKSLGGECPKEKRKRCDIVLTLKKDTAIRKHAHETCAFLPHAARVILLFSFCALQYR